MTVKKTPIPIAASLFRLPILTLFEQRLKIILKQRKRVKNKEKHYHLVFKCTHSLGKHKIFKPSRLTAGISHLVTRGKTASSESSNCKFSPSCLRRATQCSAPSTKTRARDSRLPLRHGDFTLTSVMTAARAVCHMPHTAQFTTFKSEPSKRSLEADPLRSTSRAGTGLVPIHDNWPQSSAVNP